MKRKKTLTPRHGGATWLRWKIRLHRPNDHPAAEDSMKMKLCLTQERLKELLIYAPETGRPSISLRLEPEQLRIGHREFPVILARRLVIGPRSLLGSFVTPERDSLAVQRNSRTPSSGRGSGDASEPRWVAPPARAVRVLLRGNSRKVAMRLSAGFPLS